MNQQMTQQAETAWRTAQDIAMQGSKLPQDVQVAAIERYWKTRETCERLAYAARGASKIYGGVLAIVHNGAKVLGEKILDNTEKNSEAMFEAAKAVMRCKDLAEVARVQATYMQDQVATVSAQSKEFYELSTKITKETVEAANSAASRTMAELKAVT